VGWRDTVTVHGEGLGLGDGELVDLWDMDGWDREADDSSDGTQSYHFPSVKISTIPSTTFTTHATNSEDG